MIPTPILHVDEAAFGRRLLGETERLKLSRRALAGALGVTEAHVSYLLSGRRLPSLDVLLRLSRVFGRNTDWLLTG